MTDQQPYTPTTEQIELLVLGQLKQSAEKREWPVDVEADRADFRRWLATIEAAAEQRGAARALREAAKDWRWSAWADAPRNPIAAANYTGDWIENRADQMEGDDE